jgi:hypothetical protein
LALASGERQIGRNFFPARRQRPFSTRKPAPLLGVPIAPQQVSDISYTKFGIRAVRILGLSPMALRSFRAMCCLQKPGSAAGARPDFRTF